jgi:hypothetical protein
MTQDELQCLIFRMMDDINTLSTSQHYLQIALEQLKNTGDKTNVRVELLVSTYLSLADNVLDDLKHDCTKLRRNSNKDFNSFNK